MKALLILTCFVLTATAFAGGMNYIDPRKATVEIDSNRRVSIAEGKNTYFFGGLSLYPGLVEEFNNKRAMAETAGVYLSLDDNIWLENHLSVSKRKLPDLNPPSPKQELKSDVNQIEQLQAQIKELKDQLAGSKAEAKKKISNNKRKSKTEDNQQLQEGARESSVGSAKQ